MMVASHEDSIEMLFFHVLAFYLNVLAAIFVIKCCLRCFFIIMISIHFVKSFSQHVSHHVKTSLLEYENQPLHLTFCSNAQMQRTWNNCFNPREKKEL